MAINLNKNIVETLIDDCIYENGLSINYLLSCNSTQLEKTINLINSYLIDVGIILTSFEKYNNLIIIKNNDRFIPITLFFYDNCLEVFIN